MLHKDTQTKGMLKDFSLILLIEDIWEGEGCVCVCGGGGGGEEEDRKREKLYLCLCPSVFLSLCVGSFKPAANIIGPPLLNRVLIIPYHISLD